MWPVYSNENEGDGVARDHFIRLDNRLYAGTHLIIDMWGVMEADNLQLMEDALRKAVKASGATLLHIHLHHFSPNGGISGVAVLAESHISVHTWPEHSFAAFDIFMCGNCSPVEGLKVLEKIFSPERAEVKTYIRGRLEEA
jgi:S-adenosylmethionine decarboxylase